MDIELLRATADPEDAWPELLRRAQAGDEDALRRVAVGVYCKYEYRVRKLNTFDPATDHEDLQLSFFEGCMRAVPKADGRGDDFYHIGQRGIWYVLSKLRVLQRLMKRRAFRAEYHAAVDPDARDLFDVEDRCAEDFCEVVHERLGRVDITRIIANTELTGREWRVIELVLEENTGDPDGLNKRVAADQHISAQRASQVMATVREKLGGGQ